MKNIDKIIDQAINETRNISDKRLRIIESRKIIAQCEYMKSIEKDALIYFDLYKYVSGKLEEIINFE